MKFVHLHTHSHYSLLDGLSKIKDMVKLAKENGMTALALTDHGAMYGAIEFYMECVKNGIKPIIGCLPAGHLIYTREGIKNIEDIKVGDEVLTHKGRFRKVTQLMKREHKGLLYGLKASNSNMVWVTEEHPVLATDHKLSEPRWIRADQLKYGRRNKKGGLRSWNSYVAFPKLKECGNNNLYPLKYLDKTIYGECDGLVSKVNKFNKYDSVGKYSLPKKFRITEAFARFLGLFIAEGSFQKDPKGRPTALSFAFANNETGYINFVSEYVNGLSPNKTNILKRQGKNLTEVIHPNTILARLFFNLTRAGAGAKRIPPPVFSWSMPCIKRVLEGIVQGDGRIKPDNNGATVLRVKSRDLAWGVKLVAATLGYPCKVALRNEGATLRGVTKNRTVYQVCWSPHGSYKRVLEDGNYLFLPLKEIETKKFNGFVYNFSVEEDNSYVSEFILHNCEVYVANRTRFQKEPHVDNKRYHLTLLAKNNTGYQNLIKLTTAAHLEGYYYKPRVDKELLREHSEGLIALSGCPAGELGRAIKSGNMAKAEEVIKDYQSIFGPENYYLEVMNHPDVEFFQEWKSALIEFSRKLNIPLVATQDSHYLHPDDAFAHKTLVAISTQTDVADTKIFSGNGQYHFISTEEALEWFKDIPEAIENTEKIAEKCNVNLTLGKFVFPNFELEEGKTADDKLRELAYKGLDAKDLANQQEAIDRLEYELGIIKLKGYAPYFLVVEDLIHFATNNNIYTNIRGSVAGSLTTYLLGITKLNPIDYKIPFERFLNPDRPSAPDIDMDFADNRRQEVIDYAKKKYGADKVAQIGTFGTMMARGAVRDVARALGKPYETGDRIARSIPMGSQGFPMTIDRAMELEPELNNLYNRDLETRQILDVAKKLEGTVRHISVHAAGVIIAPQPLSEYVPIQFDPRENDKLITQYDMYSIVDEYGGIGLTKLDFLGIRNLTILEDAVRLVKEHCHIDIDIENIPLDDKKTFEMLARGETEGLFQLNGDGMTKHLKELKPSTIHDINTMVALYRPGPMQFIPEYIRRKHNPDLISYLDPALEHILKPTYGILVYQDDLLIMAHDLAGYSWGEADKLRKAVGKKIPAEMAKQKEKFIQGCVEHSGWSRKKAEEVWNWVEPFAAYGFNKAHSASYGRVAYQTAYMKANFPAEYMCAVLTAEAGDTEKVADIITECQRMKIPVLSPDINSSFKDFTVNHRNTEGAEKTEIRFGLLTIKNLGEGVADAIIAERNKDGEFKNIDDFVTRVQNKDLNKKSFESLIKCGALDVFGERNQILANLEALLSYAHEKQKNANRGQTSLFGDSAEVSLPPLRLTPVGSARIWDKLMWEKELLGLYVSAHPLNEYQQTLHFERVLPIKNVSSATAGTIKIGGIITKTQKITTKTGRPMVFSWLEDLTSKIEVVVFPNVLEKNPDIWKENSIVVATGKINDRDGSLKFLCDDVKILSAVA